MDSFDHERMDVSMLIPLIRRAAGGSGTGTGTGTK
jgi:hypothetical protein